MARNAARHDARWGEFPGFAGEEGTGTSPVDRGYTRNVDRRSTRSCVARIVGELTAHTGSWDVSIMLRITELTPPSRAFSATPTTQMAAESAKEIPQFEQAARDVAAVPTKVGSVGTDLQRRHRK